jgi:hypothetical protein
LTAKEVDRRTGRAKSSVILSRLVRRGCVETYEDANPYEEKWDRTIVPFYVFVKWPPARCLSNQSDQKGGGVATIIPQTIRDAVRGCVSSKFGTVNKAAKHWNCSIRLVYDVMNGVRRPTEAMLRDIGYRRVDTYLPVGVEIPMAAVCAHDAANMGFSTAAQIVQAEIDRAEALLNVEEGGKPVFNAAQMDAGICALRTVLTAIQREAGGCVEGVHPVEAQSQQFKAGDSGSSK